MPKSNDFQILIEWMYLPSFRWIDKIPFKLSSGQASPSKKDIFGHVTFLIGKGRKGRLMKQISYRKR